MSTGIYYKLSLVIEEEEEEEDYFIVNIRKAIEICLFAYPS